MSGIKRSILAELAHKGVTGEAAISAMSPDKIRAEKGRSVYSSTAKRADYGPYLGKNGKDANP